MKKLLCFAVFFGLFIGNPLILYGQNKKANDPCSNDAECGKKYYCVEVKVNGVKKKVCSTCNQSTLDRYTAKVQDCCKTLENAYSVESSQDYKNAFTRDKKIEAAVFDIMIEKAEACIKAREERDLICFEGGDGGHNTQVNQVQNTIKDIIAKSRNHSGKRELIYCSKDDYEDALDDYESKCQVRNARFFVDIKEKIRDMRVDYNGNKKIDCSALEKYMKQCYECYETTKDLLEDCFDGNDLYFPKNFREKMNEVKPLFEDADKLLDNIKSKKLCK